LREERGMAGDAACVGARFTAGHALDVPGLLVVQSRLPSSKRHCPSLLNNPFSAFPSRPTPPLPLLCEDPLGLRRCVTTSDDNFLGDQVRNPASRPAVNHPAGAPTYIGSRTEGWNAVGGAVTIAFPERELSSPRNIVADIVFDARNSARRRLWQEGGGDNGENATRERKRERERERESEREIPLCEETREGEGGTNVRDGMRETDMLRQVCTAVDAKGVRYCRRNHSLPRLAVNQNAMRWWRSLSRSYSQSVSQSACQAETR